MLKLLPILSNTFDIIAFFLVTIDLYGERLENWHKNIIKLKPIKLYDAFFIFMRVRILFPLTLLMTAIGMERIGSFFKDKMPQMLIIFIGFIICGIIAFIVFIILFVTGGLIIKFYSKMIKYLQSKPLKSFMLPLGVIFFLLSKIISFVTL